MNLTDARCEAQRYLDYLGRQRGKAALLGQIAGQVRRGEIASSEGQRLARSIDASGVVVYDGAKLEEAITTLLKATLC